MAHLVRRFRAASALEDELVAALWAAGTCGVETRPLAHDQVLVEAWFEPGAAFELAAWPALASVEPLGEERAPALDWMAAWRAAARPFAIGRHLLVDPREPDQPPPVVAGRVTLRVPARAAFGVGSHESTRLALELLERTDVRGRDVLDVGTGTGILAFAALAFGARLAVAFDDDAQAPPLAALNARLNRLAPALFAGATAALRPRPRFDLLLVNVIPEQIRPELGALVGLLRPGGAMIVSGVLRQGGRAWLAELRAVGLERVGRRVAGEWVAYSLRRTGAPPGAG